MLQKEVEPKEIKIGLKINTKMVIFWYHPTHTSTPMLWKLLFIMEIETKGNKLEEAIEVNLEGILEGHPELITETQELTLELI